MARIRFQLDEHVDKAVADELRRLGIDIVTAADLGLRGNPDPAVIARAFQEHRVLVTYDVDYLDLAWQVERHAGIVYCGRRSRSVGHIVKTLTEIHGTMLPEETIGWLYCA